MNYTILAVDDEPANLRMLERLFHKDYRVLTATSGENALSILQKESVSLIITDQRMPGMSGTELLKESLSTNPDTIKIILTGYTDMAALTDAINTTRVYKFVSKPWDPIALKQTVQNAFREHERVIRQKQLLNDLISLVRGYPDIFNAEPAQTDINDQAADFDVLRAGVEKLVN